MQNEASKEVPKKTKGFLGVGLLAVLAKGGALLFGHGGAAAAVHVAEEAAPVLVHAAAPAIGHEAIAAAGHGAASAVAHSSLVEDSAGVVGKAMANPDRMSDAERIGRNALGVAKSYARKKAREAEQDHKKE